ncbi:MAG: AmmeMemoRadiSam system protein B [Spirochaetales bacterium]|nr:AmmeMemoRadiSam system protein B [Spirochaetales bacterium]
MNVRPPAVAGQFYPGDRKGIVHEIETQLEREGSHIDLALAKKSLIGGVSPHAGYIFCLPQAVHLFQILRSSSRTWSKAVLINPNHTGLGAPLSLDSHHSWSTPLGETDLDEELREFLLLHSAETDHPMDLDSFAQKREHSGEVILPLLQYFLPPLSLTPLCMRDTSFGAVSTVAAGLARFREASGITPLLIASSDFTHFQSPEEGQRQDDYALEALLNLDTKEFLRRVREKGLSICGYGPIAVLLEYAKIVSSRPRVSLLKRGHSGESAYFRGREQREVVDYISLLVHEE